MVKFLLAAVVEVIVGVMFAGLILALTIPMRSQPGTEPRNDPTAQLMIASVLTCTVGIALFRPGSAIRRYTKARRSKTGE